MAKAAAALVRVAVAVAVAMAKVVTVGALVERTARSSPALHNRHTAGRVHDTIVNDRPCDARPWFDYTSASHPFRVSTSWSPSRLPSRRNVR